MAEYKQVILVRMDLKMPRGKLVAQAAHACLAAVSESSKSKLKRWNDQGSKKVVLRVESQNELVKFFKRAKKAKLKAALIKDAGLTVLRPATATCVAIGPDVEEKLDKITGDLRVL